jgi:hypothetical protein
MVRMGRFALASFFGVLLTACATASVATGPEDAGIRVPAPGSGQGFGSAGDAVADSILGLPAMDHRIGSTTARQPDPSEDSATYLQIVATWRLSPIRAAALWFRSSCSAASAEPSGGRRGRPWGNGTSTSGCCGSAETLTSRASGDPHPVSPFTRSSTSTRSSGVASESDSRHEPLPGRFDGVTPLHGAESFPRLQGLFGAKGWKRSAAPC